MGKGRRSAHDQFFSIDQVDFFRVFEEERTAHVGGRHWRMHKTDKDKWPSDPHAIDDNGDKLDLSNGDIYSSVTRKYKGKLTQKELKAVREALKIS